MSRGPALRAKQAATPQGAGVGELFIQVSVCLSHCQCGTQDSAVGGGGVCMHVCIYTCIYTCVFIWVCIYVCVLMWHACVGTHAYTYKYVCIHTRVCVHIMCVFNRNKGSFGIFICGFFFNISRLERACFPSCVQKDSTDIALWGKWAWLRTRICLPWSVPFASRGPHLPPETRKRHGALSLSWRLCPHQHSEEGDCPVWQGQEHFFGDWKALPSLHWSRSPLRLKPQKGYDTRRSLKVFCLEVKIQLGSQRGIGIIAPTGGWGSLGGNWEFWGCVRMRGS